MRQLVRVVAVFAAYACAIYGGRAVVPFARAILKMPDAVLSVLGGAVLAFLVYSIIAAVGTVLFKRTGQHATRAVRLVWGSSGALIGIFFGALFVWLVFTGVRLIGSVAAAQFPARDSPTNTTMPVWNRPLRIEGRPEPNPQANKALAATLAQMKNSLEQGSLGGAVKEADPISPGIYRTLEKLGAVSANVESAERFLSFPGAREIGEHPKIVALRNDPEIVDLVAHGHLLELLQNQRIIDAANDPTLRERIGRFDLERALDYALQRK